MRAHIFRHIVCLLSAALAIAARAQSFNVDVDLFNSGPDVGGGAPSFGFGAAAVQPGFWNAFPTGFPGPFALKNLSGSATGVSISATGMGGGLGFNNPANTGDYNLLLNDGDMISNNFQYTISGLQPGDYLVYTYSVRPNGQLGSSDITVPGSITPNPQHVSGVMPGNQFILGVTHSIHEVIISNGVIQIQASAASNNYINGFQITAVPEPAASVALTTGAAALILRLKSRV